MRGQRVRWQILPLLFASAAMGFAQTSGLSVSPAGDQAPRGSTPAAPPEPVGPGTINYVEGQVSINGQEITAHSIGTATLKPGQVLNTGTGYAEVLLTPGAFLRVGNDSELRILSAGLADTATELVRGGAILEVDQIIKGTNLAVLMNGTTTTVEKKGLYDFDTPQQAVMVLDGKARINEPVGSQTLSKHDEVLIASRRPLKRCSFNEKNVRLNPLFVWSKARSEDEAQASASAASNAGAYETAGPGWYWDPAWDFYGFWPAADALYSPFGWGFYSPAFFGLGYYGGGYYGGGYYPGRRFDHDHDGDRRAGWAARRGWGGRQTFAAGQRIGGWHGRVGGMNARMGGVRSGGFGRVGGGFHGGAMGGGGFHGGFHGGGGGFHSGGSGHR